MSNYPSGWNPGHNQGYPGGPPHGADFGQAPDQSHLYHPGQNPYQAFPPAYGPTPMSQGGDNRYSPQFPPGGQGRAVFTPGPNVARQGWLGPAYDRQDQRNSGGPAPGNAPGVAPRFPHYSQNNWNSSSRISDSDFRSRSSASSGGLGYVQPHGYTASPLMPSGMPGVTPHSVRAFANQVPVGPGLPIPGGRGRRAPSYSGPSSNGSDESIPRSAVSSDPNMYVVGHLSLGSGNSNRSGRSHPSESLARRPEQIPAPAYSVAAAGPSRKEASLEVTADHLQRCPKCKGIIYNTDEGNHEFECPNNESKKDDKGRRSKGKGKGKGKEV
ncbi:hypothetical protein BT96DRAFT_942536 [Gymnopus androsaceus JB14]|uniref:Uncharacterized protein n=1 Tax=Gymnopus androsaceus JB14 TaxID=1447944 RepID=A0A6A4HDF3_9AGAR|nr:hypothetical protein BT96DRAFT_942536 [Gymnopus androsaceus JB14]